MLKVSSTTRMRTHCGAILASAAAFCAVAPAAHAADKIFWTNQTPTNTISSANLDGSGSGANLDTTGAAAVSNPSGVAIDAAAGKIYWADGDATPNGKISFANLSGGGGGELNTTDATVDKPSGLAIDPAGGRIYWANFSAMNSVISYAELDGSGSGDLDTSGGAAPFRPSGVAIDPAANKIYWASFADNFVGFANLDGTGGATHLDTAPLAQPPQSPTGVSIDKSAGRIYWTNTGLFATAPIASAQLAPGGGGDELDTSAAPPLQPYGAAIDPAANRIYWADNANNALGFADLDDSGGGALVSTTGVTPSNPVWPAILKSPGGAGAPQISGGSTPGSTLTCSNGTWAPDDPGAHMSRAPASFAIQWSRDGTDIGGATSNTITADQVGTYACKVTATNFAGSNSQTGTVAVKNPNNFTLGKPKANRKKGNAKVSINVPGAGSVSLSGDKVAGASINAAAAGDVSLTIKAKGKAKKQLKKKGKAKVSFSVTFSPTGGDPRTEDGSVTLKKKH